MPKDTIRKFVELRDARNKAAHSPYSDTDKTNKEWEKSLNIAKELLRGIKKARDSGYKYSRKIDTKLDTSTIGGNTDKST